DLLAAISHLGTELVECFFKFLTHFGGYIALRSTLRPVHDWQLCVRRDKHLAWLAVNAVKCPHQGAVLKPSYLNPARLLADNVEVVTGFSVYLVFPAESDEVIRVLVEERLQLVPALGANDFHPVPEIIE